MNKLNKFSLDYNELESALEKPKSYRYEDVKHKLTKVAYNMVRFAPQYEDCDGLWEVQATDDGDVIIAMYDEDDVQTKVASDWNAVLDSSKKNVHIFYKDQPVKKIASTQLSVSEDELSSVCDNLVRKLASEKDFRNLLLEELSGLDRVQLFSKYPELAE